MRAIVTAGFTGQGEADKEPRRYKPKEEIAGNLAFQAVAASGAEWIDPPSAAEADALRSQPAPKYPIVLDAKPAKPEGGGQGGKPEGGALS